MYDTADGIVYETYSTLSEHNHPWLSVIVTEVEFVQDCECEGDTCEHRIVVKEINADHPALPGRFKIGKIFRARVLKDLDDDGRIFKCIKIFFGRGIVGVATHRVEPPRSSPEQ